MKVRADGTVKVLDFGLAKALAPAPTSFDKSQSTTMTSPAETRMGVILVAAAYMSPEQARGKPVDKRADIWAYGVVLYECLVGGKPVFGRDRFRQHRRDTCARCRLARASIYHPGTDRCVAPLPATRSESAITGHR